MTRHAIRELLTDGGNHRQAVFRAINREFIRYAVEFLERAHDQKAQWSDRPDIGDVDEEWYIDFLRAHFGDMDEAVIIGAIPNKMIGNIYGGQGKDVVRSALEENVKHLVTETREALALGSVTRPATLNMKGLDFTPEQTLLLINSLAVKRQQINGGFWSAVGNAVEVPLIRCLCMLYEIEERYHRGGVKKDNRYQVDYMLTRRGVEFRCEVKLNGRGNPESVTSAIARDPRLLFADYISEQNREKLDTSSIAWVNFSDPQGYRRFGTALDTFGIPYTEPKNLNGLDEILDEILPLA